MTRQDYFEALNGQYLEVAGTDAPNQCVDSVNFYIKWVLGFPIIEWTNAVDFPSKAGDNYQWIENTPTNAPTEGDLIVWDGEWGHIAVCIKATPNKITSFDENYPTGSPCHVQEHNYNGVLGWLHPKNNAIIAQPIANFTDQTLIPKELLGEDQNLEIQQIRGLLLDGKRDNLDLQNARKEIENLETTASRLTGELIVMTKDLKECLTKPAKPLNSPDSFTKSQLLTALINKIFFPIKKPIKKVGG